MNLKNRFVRSRAPKLFSQHNVPSPLVYYRVESQDRIWLITEVTHEDDEVRFFGYVASDLPEWRYFSLSDLEQADRRSELKVTEFKGIKVSKALTSGAQNITV
jgi:hypothetical protein